MNATSNVISIGNYDILRHGYESVVKRISSPKDFYERIITFISAYQQPLGGTQRLTHGHISALFDSVWKLGIVGQGKRYFWKLLVLSVFRNPRNLPLAITLMIYGFHFRRMAKTA